MASEIKVDTISEKTSANGVTIDGVSLKDSKIATANSVDSDAYVDGSIDAVHLSANSVDSDAYVDGSIDTAHIDALQVTGAKLNTDVISAQTELAAEPADTDEFMVSDAGVLKRIDYSLIKSANTPSFEAYMNATQTISDNTETAVEFDTENFDTDGAFDTSTYRFTPQTAGKYFVYTMVNTDSDANDNFQQGWCFIRKNGSKLLESRFDYRGGDGRCASTSVSQVVDLDGSTDYVDVYAAVNDTTGDPLIQGTQRFTVFGAYKLIGV